MLKSKKGENLLTENIVFIILNAVFLIIIVLFLYVKMDSPAVFEERYAKEIALMIDAAKPGMQISYDLDPSNGDSSWFGQHFAESVTLQNNIVTVKLREKGGYSYSFFSKGAVVEVNPNGRVVILMK